MKLFSSYQLGTNKLQNRTVMSPMTRCRAIDNLANPLIAEYYNQRAGAGLIVTEGISPSPNGLGYARIPGLYTSQQAESWKPVTSAVHAAGGRIFIQLMHSGRISHLANMPAGAEVLAPSAVASTGVMWTDEQGELPCSEPRAMTGEEIQSAIKEYAQSALYAIEAGFDGVELHGANGYLIDQFINPIANRREDTYGGSAENRNRFALEVAAAVVEAIGAERTGIRLSPHGVFNDMADFVGMTEQYADLATALGKLNLAYIHLVDHSAMGAPKPAPATITGICTNFRAACSGAMLLSGGYERDRAEADLQSGAADLIAFGRPYISNPDLVEQMRHGAELAAPDDSTFYTPGEEGYTDYPRFTG